MSINPIKIGILSCNHGHAKGYYAIKDDPHFEVVGLSTRYDAEGLERAPDLAKYPTDDALYEAHPDMEAVIIASDNKAHMEQVRWAAARGLHIFSMKIPSFDMDEYREMIELTEAKGLVCQIELEMRNHAPIYRAKELIQSGALGEVLSINMINYSHNPVWWRAWQCDPVESWGKEVPLRAGDARCRGGALADHPHIFDLVRFLTDDSIDEVYADVAPNLREGVKTEDMVRVMGRMKGGVIFSLDPSYANDEAHIPQQVAGWEKYPRPVEVTLNIVGSAGTIVANLYGKSTYMQTPEHPEYTSTYLEDPIGLWNRRTMEFYQCVREGAVPTVHLRNHLESIMAMVAAYDSISCGKPCKVPSVDSVLPQA